jgi:hypothetical protein
MVNTYITNEYNNNITVIMEDRKLHLVFTEAELTEFIEDLTKIREMSNKEKKN